MLRFEREAHGGSTEHLRYFDGAAPLSWRACLEAWRTSASFRADFSRSLAEAELHAFRWECPPLTTAALDQPFECVLIDAPELLRDADGRDFAEHFRATPDAIIRFPNLGGDAELVVPRPMVDRECYPHLAAFVRMAPAEQIDALWQAVGEALATRLGVRPVWLSTAGDGVAWLHVRLDARPKYYRHLPYRSAGT